LVTGNDPGTLRAAIYASLRIGLISDYAFQRYVPMIDDDVYRWIGSHRIAPQPVGGQTLRGKFANATNRQTTIAEARRSYLPRD